MTQRTTKPHQSLSPYGHTRATPVLRVRLALTTEWAPGFVEALDILCTAKSYPESIFPTWLTASLGLGAF